MSMQPERRRSCSPSELPRIFNQITPTRARLLSALATGRTLSEAAESIGLPFETARSEVRRLRELTGEASLRELRAWWTLQAGPWSALMASYASVVGA